MVRLRRKSLILFLALLVIGVVFMTNAYRPHQFADPILPQTIIERRSSYTNPIYASWAKNNRPEKDLAQNCQDYFNALKKLPDEPSLLQQGNYKPHHDLFRKVKWIREETKKVKKSLRKQKVRFEDFHEREIENRFFLEAQRFSKYENAFVNDITHRRNFGVCFLNGEKTSNDASLCTAISKKLYPFLLGQPPFFETAERKLDDSFSDKERQYLEGCFVNNLNTMGEGKGIVVPILPSLSRNEQLTKAIRLIKVLRATNNTLPIELVLSDSEPLRADLKKDILSAALSEKPQFPKSYHEYIKDHPEDKLIFPKQDVRFVFLGRALADHIEEVKSDSFMIALAAGLNSFEETIVMTLKTIPLLKDLSLLFKNPTYKQHGIRFFKKRANPEEKLTKYPPGYFEINDLVNKFADVTNQDEQSFGLRSTKLTHTSRVRNDCYKQLVDPSLLVVNKRKALKGLLMSLALHYYSILHTKYMFNDDKYFEGLWLGQDLARVADYTLFNTHFAVAAGILTPEENMPKTSVSKQICSSSWAQLSDVDDKTLIYVTSHQVENKVLPEFDKALKEMYTIDTAGLDEKDDALYEATVKKNPLRIRNAIRPLVIDELMPNHEGELETPWAFEEKFGSLDDFYCAFDVVGSANTPTRGIVVKYLDNESAWYNCVVDIWSLSLHQRSSNMASYD